MQSTTTDAPSLTRQRGQLWRVLGVGFGLAVIIGNTIGAGIFRAPGTIAEQLPNPWFFLGVWVLGALYALLGAISLAELGTMIPRSGGQYVYSRYALGEYAGFIVGWSDWISSCGSTATVSLLIGQFSGALVPSLAGRGPAVAAVVAIVFAVLQWRGILWGSNIQNLTSLLKALAFVALIVAAFALGSGVGYKQSNIYNPPGNLALLIVPIIISLREVIYTYDGWSGVIYFSEEVKNPARDIPRSLFGGVLTIAAIYLLVNVGLLYVLPVKEIAGKEFAAGEAANVIFGSYGDRVFRVLTIVSMLSGINALHLMATRVIFGMSRDGLFTTKAAVVNKGGTPSVALWLSALVAILFIIFGQTAGQVITIVSFFFVANYVLSFISLFVLRRREPDKPRPYRAWGYPWTTGLALIGSVLFLAGAVAGDTWNSIYALLLLAVSYPVFMVVKRLR
ncbi:MAG TPA: APC family permease [Pyrinomonadaceae bacterium]|nr:APC family permease [Pyrinomonadaceae bacterium]